jgi:hypothetical protein
MPDGSLIQWRQAGTEDHRAACKPWCGRRSPPVACEPPRNQPDGTAGGFRGSRAMYTGGTPEVHRRYTGGTPDAQQLFRCASGVPPVYTALELPEQGGGGRAALLGTTAGRVMLQRPGLLLLEWPSLLSLIQGPFRSAADLATDWCFRKPQRKEVWTGAPGGPKYSAKYSLHVSESVLELSQLDFLDSQLFFERVPLGRFHSSRPSSRSLSEIVSG